ncbi:MAG: tripartite tricarboxylate transporter substrate binding protein [Burkholderiales bacterium]|nr:tripartite tricarboxylate transporter substrate binding protein [Burkholderiales bacterium]
MKLGSMTLIAGLGLAMAGPMASGQPSNADTFPDRPVRMLVGYPPGGNVDIAARIIADELSRKLGQPVIVENRAGASGQIAAVATMQAPPDGYTIFLGASPELAITHALKRKVSYDSRRDFQPISLATQVPFALVVNPSVKAKTVQELIALAKAQPGSLNYASFGDGSSNHLFAELFKHKTGIQMTHIPYKGGGPAIADLVGGQVQVEFESLGVVLPHVKAGKLRALAIAMSERSPLAPDIPTMAEAGLPGLEGGTWNGFVGPAGMPPAITKKLSQKIVEAMNEPTVKQKLIEKGVVPSAGTPEAFGKFIASEIDRWGQVAEVANIKLE